MNRFSIKLRSCSLVLALVVLFTLALRSTLHAAQSAPSDAGSGKFIFILDGSGSMNGQVQGRAKMDVAKEVLSGLVGDIPEGVNVGLVAYGHRQKGDCSDVEELSPLAAVNKPDLIGKIKAIVPKGMTPITYSVQKVAEGLRGVETEATIILVSDGEETCKGDPCALVKELKASGIKFVLHVIGFDVTDKEKEQLACLAKAGGGSYFTARNAGELKLAAKRAVEDRKPAMSELTIRAVKDGKPLRAFGQIVNGEGDDKAKAAESWLDGGRKAFQLSPGLYEVSVENRDDPATPPITFQGVLLEPGSKVERVADFSGGVLIVKALRNGVPAKGYCTVYKTGGGEAGKVTEGWTQARADGFKLAAGSYEVVVENREDANGSSVKVQNITVEPGKAIEKVVEFSGGTIRMKAVRNEKPLRAYCIVYKGAEDGEENEREKIVEGWISPESTPFNVAPGSYDVLVEDQEDAGKPTKSFEGVTVEAGKTVERVADFSGGTLRVAAKRNGVPFSAFCWVVKSDAGAEGGKKRVAQGWTRKDGALLKLEPGVYDLVVQNQEDAGKPVLNFPGITIEADKTLEKVADFSGGALKVMASRNGKAFSALCTVFPAEGEERKIVTRGWAREEGATFQLLPGVYDIVVENQEDASKPKVELKGITIEAGKTVEKIAEFSGGTLKVKASRNGKVFAALCTVFPAEGEERKIVTRGWAREEGATFQLLPGVYDLVVENQEDASKPKVELKGITIEAGKTVEKVAEFSGGSLKVKALRNGKPFSAVCSVYPSGEAKDRKRITGGWTREEGASFQLLPGVYDVEVENQTDANKPKVELAQISIEAGKTVEKVVEFSGGELRVRALRGGKPFSAMCLVFSGDEGPERKQVARSLTREEGATFQLLPGTYTLVLEDGKSREKKEIKETAVEPGKSRTIDVEF
ncbi:MAG: vWA domain-containing protein [Acidobacteriota bacterium]